MGYATVAAVILGLGLGATVRLKVLLPVLAVLLVVSIVFSMIQGRDILHTAVAIFEAQACTQVGYFLGVVARAIFYRMRRCTPYSGGTTRGHARL
jgi:hypothetical protein